VSNVPHVTRSDAEEFLYREARLLDERRFDEWLALFTEDARYWIPQHEDDDPGVKTPILYDDYPTLKTRIWRLRNPNAHAQSPASRTRHYITNVEVEANGSGEATIYSNVIIYEARTGAHRSCAGWCEHKLRWDEAGWRIAQKKICLINADEPIYNLTFLL
jgi:3-phenylpropionate/cinnamic acid dioxygenase small subunit